MEWWLPSSERKRQRFLPHLKVETTGKGENIVSNNKQIKISPITWRYREIEEANFAANKAPSKRTEGESFVQSHRKVLDGDHGQDVVGYFQKPGPESQLPPQIQS
jgi:hypothetical protein